MVLKYSGFFSYCFVRNACKLDFMSTGVSVFSVRNNSDLPLAGIACVNDRVAKIAKADGVSWEFFATSEGLVQLYTGFAPDKGDV